MCISERIGLFVTEALSVQKHTSPASVFSVLMFSATDSSAPLVFLAARQVIVIVKGNT